MSQIVKGSFASAGSANLGVNSDALVIPSGVTSMKLSVSGLDASNTVKSQKSTNNGHTWADQTTYNSNQSAVAVTVAHGEQWRLFVITQQVTKLIDYIMSAES